MNDPPGRLEAERRPYRAAFTRSPRQLIAREQITGARPDETRRGAGG